MKSGSLSLSSAHDREKIIELLRQGHVVAGGSDTILGLLVRADEKGYKKLCELKQRDEKRFIILVDCKEKIFDFIDTPLSASAEKLTYCWPAPLTIIFTAKKGIAPCLVADRGTIAFRVPAHADLLAVLKQTGPLFSTSANLSGQQVPQSVAEIDPVIKQAVAALIAVETTTPLPSTIVDCSGSVCVLVRTGAYNLSTRA